AFACGGCATGTAVWWGSGRRSTSSSGGSPPSGSAPRSSTSGWRSRSCDGRLRARGLQRLAAQELRHFTDEPGGLADEKMLQRGQTVDETEADVAQEAQRVRLVGEQPVEPVGRNPHRHA